MAIFNKRKVEGYDYDTCCGEEGNRLRTQARILHNFDMPVYDEIFESKVNATVLDIGCNEGDSAMDRLNGRNISEYIGIDRSIKAITAANNKYGDDCTHFYQMDVEAADFSVRLCQAMQRHNIDRVDVITISLLLLHLADPAALVRQLYPFLKPGGTIFIKDIDDRDNRAEGDGVGFFEESYAIANANKDSGNRNVGREVPMYLKEAGFKNIRCVRKGITTKGMNKEEREALFQTYYGFFIPDSLAQIEYEKQSKQSIYNYGWVSYYIPKIHDLFLMDGFNFTLGFQTYLATREW